MFAASGTGVVVARVVRLTYHLRLLGCDTKHRQQFLMAASQALLLTLLHGAAGHARALGHAIDMRARNAL